VRRDHNTPDCGEQLPKEFPLRSGSTPELSPGTSRCRDHPRHTGSTCQAGAGSTVARGPSTRMVTPSEYPGAGNATSPCPGRGRSWDHPAARATRDRGVAEQSAGITLADAGALDVAACAGVVVGITHARGEDSPAGQRFAQFLGSPRVRGSTGWPWGIPGKHPGSPPAGAGSTGGCLRWRCYSWDHSPVGGARRPKRPRPG
jgi:hypothetical protein